MHQRAVRSHLLSFAAIRNGNGRQIAAGRSARQILKFLHCRRTKAEAASRQLQTVGAKGWESAKTSFEKASRELAEAWHKIHPEEK